MNADIQAQLDVIKAPAQAQLDAVAALPALIDKDKADFGASEYIRGQNSMAIPSATLPDGTVDPTLKYTQDEVDKMAAADALDKQNAVDSAIAQTRAEEQAKYNALLATAQSQAELDKAAAVEAKRKEIMDDYANDVAAFEANHSAPIAPPAPVDPSASVSAKKSIK